MVKGTTRRVIVIKSPDPRLFDEAIFIVKDDALRGGVTERTILMEAQQVADRYVKQNLRQKRRFKLPPIAFIGIGTLITATVWILCSLF